MNRNEVDLKDTYYRYVVDRNKFGEYRVVIEAGDAPALELPVSFGTAQAARNVAHTLLASSNMSADIVDLTVSEPYRVTTVPALTHDRAGKVSA